MSELFNHEGEGLFDMETSATMGQALDFLSSARPTIDKEVLARKIVEVARTGERDVVRLCTKVLHDVDALNEDGAFPHGNF